VNYSKLINKGTQVIKNFVKSPIIAGQIPSSKSTAIKALAQSSATYLLLGG
jgi:hypothetical protein